MSQIDYNKLFQTCVFLCQFKQVKTLDPKIIQYAFRILYTGNNLFKQAQSNAVKYVQFYHSNEISPSKFKKANKLKKSLKKYLDTDAQNIYSCDFRISGITGIFLAGLDDVFDGSAQSQWDELKNPSKTTKTTKTKSTKEPTPEDCLGEDLIEEDNEEYELGDEDGDVEEDVEEEEEPIQAKPKAKSKTKSANI
jgi:hypothetical protein